MAVLKRSRTSRLPDGTRVPVASLWGVHLNVFAVATLAALAHTIDEVRIGELIAVPFALVNLAVVVAWPRLRRSWRIGSAFGFGLFWGLAVIPYHVMPLLAGDVTWQNVSGLTRLIAGVMMVGLGLSMVVERRPGAPVAGDR